MDSHNIILTGNFINACGRLNCQQNLRLSVQYLLEELPLQSLRGNWYQDLTDTSKLLVMSICLSANFNKLVCTFEK